MQTSAAQGRASGVQGLGCRCTSAGRRHCRGFSKSALPPASSVPFSNRCTTATVVWPYGRERGELRKGAPRRDSSCPWDEIPWTCPVHPSPGRPLQHPKCTTGRTGACGQGAAWGRAAPLVVLLRSLDGQRHVLPMSISPGTLPSPSSLGDPNAGSSKGQCPRWGSLNPSRFRLHRRETQTGLS